MKKQKNLFEYKQKTKTMHLAHRTSSGLNEFVLWDSEILKDEIIKYFKQDIHLIMTKQKVVDLNTIIDWAFHYFMSDKIYMKYIIGTISTKKLDKAWGAHEVIYSAAEKGYGPLLYDAALSYCDIITPDRSSVSGTAEAVWYYYYNSRNDVEKLPFDDISDPKTPPTEDDAKLHTNKLKPMLNYAYKAKRKIFDVNALDSESNQALQKMILDIYDEVAVIIKDYKEYAEMPLKMYEKYQYIKTSIIESSEYYFADKLG